MPQERVEQVVTEEGRVGQRIVDAYICKNVVRSFLAWEDRLWEV